MSQFNCRLDDQTQKMLKAIARANERSKSQTVRFLVRQEYTKLVGSGAAPGLGLPAREAGAGGAGKEVVDMD